jgi:hypothetical protein
VISTIKTAAQTTEKLSQSNVNSDAKQDGIQRTKARLGQTLKKKYKTK